MHRALLKKSFLETRLLLACCVAWLFIFCWIRVWIVSRLERGRFQAILEQFGDIVSTFSPVSFAHLLSFTGRIAVGFDEALVVLVLLAFAITRGSDVVSGELNRGTMEILLAQPVRRFEVIVSQALVTVIGLFLLAAAVWWGTWLGIHTAQAKIERQPALNMPLGYSVPLPFVKPTIEKVPMSSQVDARLYVPAAINLFCLGYSFAGLATLISACDRYRWRTVGLTIGILVLQMVSKVIGIASADWRWLKYSSLFTVYEPQKVVEIALNNPAALWSWSISVSEGQWVLGPLTYYSVLLAAGTLFYGLSIFAFSRRDLPAPL